MSGVRVHRLCCPAEERADYDGKCWEGYTYDYAGQKYTCSECDGKGYILVVTKEDIFELIGDDIIGMIEKRLLKDKAV